MKLYLLEVTSPTAMKIRNIYFNRPVLEKDLLRIAREHQTSIQFKDQDLMSGLLYRGQNLVGRFSISEHQLIGYDERFSTLSSITAQITVLSPKDSDIVICRTNQNHEDLEHIRNFLSEFLETKYPMIIMHEDLRIEAISEEAMKEMGWVRRK
jgi:hypothetical protein